MGKLSHSSVSFLILSDNCVFVDVGCSLWREDTSVVYNCSWSSPAQSFLGPSPVRLAQKKFLSANSFCSVLVLVQSVLRKKMLVEYSTIGIRDFVISHVMFDSWRLQFTKIVCHAPQLRFSSPVLCSFAWRWTVIEVLSPVAVVKIEIHTVHFTTVVSSKLTSCINGNSTFNKPLKVTLSLPKHDLPQGTTRLPH
jgi:hypothetical protein